METMMEPTVMTDITTYFQALSSLVPLRPIRDGRGILSAPSKVKRTA
jgi:hypothetical protein